MSAESRMSRPQSTSLTQGHRTLRPLDPTAPYEMLELSHLGTKIMVCLTLLKGRAIL